MEFGVLVPHGIYAEYSGLEVTEHWDSMRAYAARVESLGFHSLWVSDHLDPVFGPPSSHLYESWTALCALSQHTTQLRLGQLVLCNGFRQPPVLAKMAATLDVISSGRVILGLGAGWSEKEFARYGLTFADAAVRLRQLEEAVTVIRRMWGPDEASFAGEYFSLAGAQPFPKPLQDRLPILVGGVGRAKTLRIVATHADFANFHGNTKQFGNLSECLDRHCDVVGRDPREIQRTALFTQAVVRETEEEVARAIGGLPLHEGIRVVPPRLSGTPARVAERLHRYQLAGCSLALLNFCGAPAIDDLELFADQVMPLFPT